MDLTPQPQSSSLLYQQAIKSIKVKRKHSKKIRKVVRSFCNSKGTKSIKSQVTRKKSQNQENIINVLKERDVPAFLIDLVKNKRILSFSNLKEIKFGKINNQDHKHLVQDCLIKQQTELLQIIKVDQERKQNKKCSNFKTPVSNKYKIFAREEKQYQFTSIRAKSEMESQSSSFIQKQNQDYPQVSMFDLQEIDLSSNIMRFRDMSHEDLDVFGRLF